jgi:hypothetical protein
MYANITKSNLNLSIFYSSEIVIPFKKKNYLLTYWNGRKEKLHIWYAYYKWKLQFLLEM